ncbi:Oidioi.mRNA.OKI2018_I69.PAR.g12019.t1.cds [Oikopleura dioica]|uniref:Oidioi.mRNA.OKI2018_I69.PAR.g12019.t1.cds n=1 Tax=Oikopleura dioica TaxID=34765 RepID=A0ABN7S5V0_OIKDI|nr:Oidioi.mRNA.OKI2018_I69.PAR.g12019.t1.cds [Oikopleura dioica]
MEKSWRALPCHFPELNCIVESDLRKLCQLEELYSVYVEQTLKFAKTFLTRLDSLVGQDAQGFLSWARQWGSLKKNSKNGSKTKKQEGFLEKTYDSFILFARKEIDARTQLSTTLEKNVIKTIHKTKTAIKERNEKFIKDHNIQAARRIKAEEKLEFYFNEYKKTHEALMKFDKNNKKGSKLPFFMKILKSKWIFLLTLERPKKSGKGVLSKEERIARERKYKVSSMETAENDYTDMVNDFNIEQQNSFEDYLPRICSNLEDLHEDLLKRVNQIQLNAKDSLTESVRLVSAACGCVCYHDKDSFPDVISAEHRLIIDNVKKDHPRSIPADKQPKMFLNSKNGSVSTGSSSRTKPEPQTNFTSPAASEKFKHNPHIRISPRPSQSPPSPVKAPDEPYDPNKLETGSLADSFVSELESLHLYEKIEPALSNSEPSPDDEINANKKREPKSGRMLYDFDGTDSNGNDFPDAVKCKKGDLLEVLEDSSNENWSKVKIISSQNVGFVPTQFLAITPPKNEDSESAKHVLKDSKTERLVE